MTDAEFLRKHTIDTLWPHDDDYPRLKAIAQRLEDDEWRNIETAPKNTPILVTTGEITAAIERLNWAGKDNWIEPVGVGGSDCNCLFYWEDLTHWKPL
jgi:hypothetical protein